MNDFLYQSNNLTLFCVIGYHGGVTGLTCRGDSGSPLVFFDSIDLHYVQVGIVSGGSCQSFTDPAIFARIEDSKTLDFISKQILAQNADSLPKPRIVVLGAPDAEKSNISNFLLGCSPGNNCLSKTFKTCAGGRLCAKEAAYGTGQLWIKIHLLNFFNELSCFRTMDGIWKTLYNSRYTWIFRFRR